jgi:hypothetical protein
MPRIAAPRVKSGLYVEMKERKEAIKTLSWKSVA